MKLVVLSHEISVDFESPGMWKPDGMGRANALTCSIKINSALTPDVQASTLIHELIHIISDLLDLGIGDNEILTSGITVGLLDAMRRNPELVELLVGRSESHE